MTRSWGRARSQNHEPHHCGCRTSESAEQVPEPIELRDPSGRVVGYFTPEVGPELTEEEEEQIYKENKWYTFDEVMAHLKSLEQQ